MSRNHLLHQSIQPRPPGPRGVWRMTMDLLGQAFGLPPEGSERRR
jgi:hypothetical protein